MAQLKHSEDPLANPSSPAVHTFLPVSHSALYTEEPYCTFPDTLLCYVPNCSSLGDTLNCKRSLRLWRLATDRDIRLPWVLSTEKIHILNPPCTRCHSGILPKHTPSIYSFPNTNYLLLNHLHSVPQLYYHTDTTFGPDLCPWVTFYYAGP